MATKPESPRELIARVLPEEVTEERIRGLIRSAFELMEGTYVADGTCTGCKKPRKVEVRVPDLQATIRVLTEWLEQGFGRPGTATAESGDVILVVKGSWFADARDRDDVPAPGAAAGVSLVEG